MKTQSAPLLDPVDVHSEILFGLIMILVSTGTISIVNGGRTEVHAMLLGALGGNLAWGIIDGVFYLLGALSAKARGLAVLAAMHPPASPDEGRRALASALPAPIAAVLEPQELESLRERLARQPRPAASAHLDRTDLLGALALVLLVVLSAIPVVIPFLFLDEPMFALRVSNGVAILLLFVAGYAHGRKTNHRPWGVGLGMVALGGALVGLAIALGG